MADLEKRIIFKKYRLRLKKCYTEKDLEKYGFVNGLYTRKLDDEILYQVVCTTRNKNIQIHTNACTIARSLQLLIYDLIVDGLVEKVEE